MPAIRTDSDVEGLIATGGVNGLRNLVASPTALHPADRAYAKHWLERQEEQGKLQRESEAHEFMRRQTVAAEESARAAKTAAKFAIWSTLVAAAMLVATAWPYFKLMDRL